ncbi:MAG: hypothetical protein AAB250_13770 [Bdellovibrionota bacterium]
MGTEHFFRFLSIALLGLIGLAAMPDRHAEPVQIEAVEALQSESDIQAALEANELNSGRYKPYMIEEDSVAVSDLDMLELDLMEPTRAVH